MSCYNTDHAPTPEGVACIECYAALDAERTALNDRYMRLLAEKSELERRVRDAEAGDIEPSFSQYGNVRLTADPGGFELVDGQAYLAGRPRSRPASEDSLVLTFGSRTTGPRGSILLERPDVEVFHDLTGRWLEKGWPGVPRRCGVHFRPDLLHEWKCDLEPGHLNGEGGTWFHEGPSIGWSSREGKPGRARWTPTGERVEW